MVDATPETPALTECERTIKFHLTNIYRKLGVTGLAGVVQYAFDHGMLEA